jgi:hypothetical protein
MRGSARTIKRFWEFINLYKISASTIPKNAIQATNKKQQRASNPIDPSVPIRKLSL